METETVFCSYARANSAFVLGLVGDLRSAGVPVWLDQTDIAAGERWDLSIQRALEACRTVLLVLSPDSVASPTVMDEASFALQEQKRIVPVLHTACDIPFRLRRVQYIDFTRDYARASRELIGRLTSRPESLAPAAPAAPVSEPAGGPRPAGGGFHIGSVGGDATFSAGGDIVAGDKITETTTSVTEIGGGFKDETDKQRFLLQIDEIRTALRGLQGEIQTAPVVSDDDKDELATAVLQQIGALRTTKEEAAGVVVAEPPSKEKRNKIAQTLQDTCAVLDRVRGVCDRTVEIADKVSPYVSKALPMVTTARELLGLH